jgi:nucleotide-binding universal stress UspA family protein
MSKHMRVLVGVDLEAGTDLALATAIGMASATPSMNLIVLHVFDALGSVDFGAWGPPGPPERIAGLKARTEQALAKFTAQNPAARVPSAEIHVSVGQAASEIVWAAAHFDVDAVVLASHGRRGLNRLLLGSVAEKVVRLAGCPVTVAREKKHDPRAKLTEIEPLCNDCAHVREQSAGQKLWCERHSMHHPRAHTYSSAGRTESPPSWGATTGS